MLNNYLKDSSKRLAGLCSIALAAVLAIILFIKSLFSMIGDSQTALTVIWYFLMAGGGLLGVTIFENLKVGKKDDN